MSTNFLCTTFRLSLLNKGIFELENGGGLFGWCLSHFAHVRSLSRELV